MATGDLRVLLISPLRGLDPPNGDVSYTESLLSSPPEGVEYVTYDQAVRSGELVWVGARGSFRDRRVKLLDSARALACRKLHRALAGRGLAFREQLLTARITGSFDLVHVHVFNVGFVGVAPPAVFSNACPTSTFYRDFERWSPLRVDVLTRIHGLLARLGGSRAISGQPLPDARWVLFSEHLVHHYVGLGVDPTHIHVVPNSVSASRTGRPAERDGALLGFCARDFEGKGGRAVIDAFRLLREVQPHLTLECVGHPCPSDLAEEPGVRWRGPVDRLELLSEVLPTWAAMIYPTRFDGVPFSVIEALSVGCPVVTVRYGAMPELVPHDIAGYIAPSTDPQSIALGVRYVTDPHNQVRLVEGAARWFASTYSDVVTRPALRGAYDAALVPCRSIGAA